MIAKHFFVAVPPRLRRIKSKKAVLPLFRSTGLFLVLIIISVLGTFVAVIRVFLGYPIVSVDLAHNFMRAHAPSYSSCINLWVVFAYPAYES